MELQGKHVVLGVTGGIAAYKAAELLRLMVKAGATVQVVQTAAAARFVTPVTFQALSGRAVFVDQWDARVDNNMAHIDLSRVADAILVAPASADILARIAHGLADDLLTTLILARPRAAAGEVDCPLLVAPAMNRQMWENPATQRNIDCLRGDGVVVLGPATGEQACGETGDGRMLEPAELLEDLVAFLAPKPLLGRRVLITAGPTFEAIDPVRGITNLSTGKMGFAIARAAREAGAEVTLVAGPVVRPTPRGVTRIDVTGAREMHAEVMRRAPDSDIFVGVAAVADYHVANASTQKIKKDQQSGRAPLIELVENPDILAEVAALPKAPYCVGFAAESENLEVYAAAKRLKKNIPLIVANLVADGFGGDSNVLVLVDAEGAQRLPPGEKSALARQLVSEIARRLAR